MRTRYVRVALVLVVLVTACLTGGAATAAGCLVGEFTASPKALCPGELLTISGSISNSCEPAMQVDVTIKIEAPGIAFVDTKKILVGGGTSMPYSQSFVVPKNAVSGTYKFHIEVTSGATEKTTADGDVAIDAC